ncbi:glutathione S-transferase [Phreatobacter aquaticus]|uniref:Glutathione S-transferase n=1 Tax=Phreatobacter aquaticus TaxID=2570229 RepID=A0A4D7QR87_9HYPH|nr:glutathione S-transferase [Phreatobacter aquaticus]QCK87764.1 glutathione S-transferase [Phreatobacter aquaticus]
MKLFYSPASPFVRKVMVCAIERGLDGRIEKLSAAAHPINQDGNIKQHNPTGKVPTLIADDGMAIYDSRVICEYLDAQGTAPRLIPAEGSTRWQALVLQSAADEMLDAALLARYEAIARPENLRWSDWSDGQKTKIRTTVEDFSNASIAYLEANVDIGTIAVACSLGYLDFRFPEIDWRKGHDRLAKWFASFSERPSMKATFPTA